MTGDQIRAARAYAGVSLRTLSEVTGLHHNTLNRMEMREFMQITSEPETVSKLIAGLRCLGVCFDGDAVRPVHPAERRSASAQVEHAAA